MSHGNIAASVVVHKTPSLDLKRALDSLLKSEVKKIYVVDNSPSESLREVAEIDPRIIYLRVPNKGYGAANNVAIKKSLEEGYDYHLVMNPDVWWEEDPISALIGQMKSNSKIGLIAPKILNPDGSLQISCRPLPTPWSLIKNRVCGIKFPQIKNNFYLLGAFMLFRCEALESEGLFDERFFLYPEDIDISRRIHRKWEISYYPEVSVYHAHQRASAKSLRMLLIHIQNMIRYFNKWGWRQSYL